MKKFLTFLIIVIAGYWVYNKYSNSDTGHKNVASTKNQVTVAVKTANLRTGPGTDYDFVAVNADGTGGKLQVTKGTKLDVVSSDNGWYQVRISGDRTAYIKKALCLSANSVKTNRKGKDSPPKTVSPTPDDSKKVLEPGGKKRKPKLEDGAVEEVTTGQAQDEVIF